MTVGNRDRFVNVYLKNHTPDNPNVVYHRMISRVLNGQTSVLPVQSGHQVQWLVLQSDGKQARDHAKEIQNFIGSYCRSEKFESHPFVAGKSELHEAGGQSFPNGYYVFLSTSDFTESNWEMLKLWMELDERRPAISPVDTERSAFTLRNQFQEQVATQQWNEASKTLEIIRQGSYVSEDNYLFLKVQWLGAQYRWEEIWYSKDFESISHLDHVPARIQHILLRASYSIVVDSDAAEDFGKSLELFAQSRHRLGSLLHKSVASSEEPICRLKAYNACVESDKLGLERLLGLVQDSTSAAIIQFLLNQLAPQPEFTVVTMKENVLAAFKLQRYDEAYHELKASLLTPFKVKYLCKIATMTDDSLVFEEAKTAWDGLSGEEQQALMSDPECRADLMLVQARMSTQSITPPISSPTSHAVPETKAEVTWHGWFTYFIEQPDGAEHSHQLLRAMDTTRGGIVWTNGVLELLAEQFAEIAMMSLNGSARSLLETALLMFLAELTTPEQFPKDAALSVYDYCSELMLAHSKKNQTTMVYLQKLSEGIVYLDFTLAVTQFQRALAWFDISPSKMVLPYLQSALELYFDYGIQQQQLVDLWNHWSGTLGDSLLTLGLADLEGWYELGLLMSADTNLLSRIGHVLDQQNETATDVLAVLPPQKVAIFTLREHTARRAIDKLQPRNPKYTYVLCTNEALTAEAKAHVSSADIVVIVSTCLSHAIFYGIQPYLRDNVVYPRSSGTTGILLAIDNFIRNKLNRLT